MDINSMHFDFKVKLDKVDSQDRRNFLPAETDWFLNEAQLIYVKRRYGINNKYNRGFEEIQKRTDDLKSLHIKSPTTIQPGLTPTIVNSGVYEAKLNNLSYDYLLFTRGTADITKDGCGSKSFISLSDTEHDDLNNTLGNNHYDPSFEWGVIPIVFSKTDDSSVTESSIYLYTNNNFSIDKVYIDYIKMPKRVFFDGYDSLDGQYISGQGQVDSELPEHTHNEIVDLAVYLASTAIEDPNYVKLKSNKLQMNE